MELKYSSYNKSNHKKDLKKIYINSFIKAERFPFFLLKNCSKGKNVVFNEVSDEGNLVGMIYIINCSNFAYLMYLAIDEKYRGNGYGSKILKDIISKNENVVLCIEKVDMDTYGEKQRRKNFYIRNGFYETNNFICDGGIEYEILCTNKNLAITEKMMRERYEKMCNCRVTKLLISKMFNVNNIEFLG